MNESSFTIAKGYGQNALLNRMTTYFVAKWKHTSPIFPKQLLHPHFINHVDPVPKKLYFYRIRYFLPVTFLANAVRVTRRFSIRVSIHVPMLH